MEQNMPCPVCAEKASLFDVVDFNKAGIEVRGVYLNLAGIPVYYALCSKCGFCFAPEIMAWKLEDFAAKIYNNEYVFVDPDYLESRPRANAENLISLFGEKSRSIRHLDYGGGNGLLSYLLREANWESDSYDPFVDQDRVFSQQDEEKYNLITAFEVFEHVPDIHKLMANLFSLLAPNGLIYFSTLLSDGNLPPRQRLNWWYAAPRNGHISLFSRNSLAILAQQNGFSFASLSESLHVFYTRLPLWARRIGRNASFLSSRIVYGQTFTVAPGNTGKLL